jgi:hypothetical protein
MVMGCSSLAGATRHVHLIFRGAHVLVLELTALFNGIAIRFDLQSRPWACRLNRVFRSILPLWSFPYAYISGLSVHVRLSY